LPAAAAASAAARHRSQYLGSESFPPQVKTITHLHIAYSGLIASTTAAVIQIKLISCVHGQLCGYHEKHSHPGSGWVENGARGDSKLEDDSCQIVTFRQGHGIRLPIIRRSAQTRTFRVRLKDGVVGDRLVASRQVGLEGGADVVVGDQGNAGLGCLAIIRR
jgi:hypothetical protein